MRESVKHRLIGAAVLAAIAVLFLPSFFKDRQQYQVDTSSQIPGRPSITAVDFNEPTRPEGIEPAPAPETMFLPDESEAVPAAQIPPPEQAAVAAEVASSNKSISSSSTTSAASVPVMPLNAQGLPDTWVIQVASLSAQAAANKLRDQLQADGHKAYVRAVPGASATTYRVFIGPKQDKAEAIAIKTQLDKRLKVNSLVLPFKP
ncbi:MAG: SPOR domain-containing protein [Cellvibrio sp.]|uniref:SPOR domain-containing protein n=1 Tax=Cellvibrio sp. TaxID=1965322 RepID=UPI00271D309A|nr:SPOR domain-containing protein [Cellvibrio sp.]